MEKRVVLAIGLTVGLYVVYFMWFAPRHPAQQPVSPRGTVAQGSVAPAPHPSDPTAGPRKVSEANPAAPDEKLANRAVDLTFVSRGGALRSAEVWGCSYHERGDRGVKGDPGFATDWVEGMPGALSVDLLGFPEEVPDLARSNWKLIRGEDSVTAAFDAAGLAIARTVRLSSDAAHPWHADVTYTVRNDGAEPGAVRTLEIVGPVLPKPAMGDDGVLVAQAGEGGEVEELHAEKIAKELAENPRLERRSATGRFAWVAVRADFYVGALVPKGDLPQGTTVGFRTGTRPDPHGPPTPTAAATFRIPLVVPPKGAETSYEFRFYAGPNERSILLDETSPYHELHGAMVQRKFLISLGPISRFMSWLLATLAGTGMGYGLAVISLTILVRGALFPLSRKSQISMRIHAQKMQRLKPKLDAIKEKYKDPKKQQEATMKVMREEKVSLLPGGCLLAFLQMPIWIALYNVLQTTFEMRHAGFLWVRDLTAPDQLLHLPFLHGVWLLPEWLNLLPILMMATWYFSAAMQPLPADPQQAQQAKMMRWMPVVMGVFLYSTAAGLTLYMTMSALWSIGETWLIRKLWLNKLEAALK